MTGNALLDDMLAAIETHRSVAAVPAPPARRYDVYLPMGSRFIAYKHNVTADDFPAGQPGVDYELFAR